MLGKRVALSRTLTNIFLSRYLIIKRTNYSTFSTNKPQQKQSTQTNSQQSTQQQENKRQRIHQQKLRQLQQQQIKDMNDRVQLTRGNYSPFVQYLKLHKGPLIGLGIALVVGLYGWRIWAMAGMYEVEQMDRRYQQVDGVTIYKYQYHGIKMHKKFSIISPKYQQQHLGQTINKIFSSIYSHMPKQQITALMSSKIASLQKKMSQYFKTAITVTPIATQQPITLALPYNNILVSKSILRSPKFNQFQLQFLFLLNQQLFRQGFHLRTLSLSQIPTFLYPQSASSEIKLRQIYARKYKRNQILHTIELVKYKLGIMQKPQQNHQIEQLFQNLKALNQQINKGKTTTSDENIYQRLFKYCIFVKIE